MKNLKRDYYLNKIRPFINKQLIKVITGQRRVGKSYLLMQIRDEISLQDRNANIIYINLEKIEYSDLKNYKQLAQLISEKLTDNQNYIFIDEIQEIYGFERVLRSYLTEPNIDIYCTGSNANLLSGELATFLSGRHIEVKVNSLSFIEFLYFHNLPPNEKSLTMYLKFGGMPFLINLKNEEEIKQEYLKNIFNTIVFRDIVARYSIRDVSFLENIIRFVADNIGSILSANNITKYLKSQNINKTTQTIINYLEYIKNSYTIDKVKRYDLHGKKIFESGEKYYFHDLGIRNNIVGFNMTEIHKIIENVVYNHLKFNDFKIFIGKLDNTEIDFIAKKNNEVIYVQVAYLLKDEKTINREFGNLLKIKDNFPKYVISMDNFSAPNSFRGIKHISLLNFLLNFK
ncbi:MAG: ATP-binding protein [Bacteroidales bacterium]|nr:ATP-binding protein [Bacteroidales bacterium]